MQKTKIKMPVYAHLKYPMRTKTVLDKKSIEQVSHWRYLGCDVTYNVDYDADHKLDNFSQNVAQALSRKIRKRTRLKFYKLVAVLVFYMFLKFWFR